MHIGFLQIHIGFLQMCTGSQLGPRRVKAELTQLPSGSKPEMRTLAKVLSHLAPQLQLTQVSQQPP